MKLDRFSRDTNDHLGVVKELAALGIRLHSVLEHIEDTPAGLFMQTILSAVARFDNDVRAERSSGGMKAALESGRWPFAPPLGFLKGSDPHAGPTLIRDPKRAGLVAQAFEMIASGSSRPHQVLKAIRGLGLTTRKNKPLSPQTFKALLRNELYAGWMVVKKWSIRQRGEYQPLVTEEVFANAQRVLDGRSPILAPRHRQNPDFPLRGFVRCATCGTPFTGSKSTGKMGSQYGYYHCRRCRKVNVRTMALEAQFVDLLTVCAPKGDFADLLTRIVSDVWKAKEQVFGHARSALSRRLSELERTETAVAEKYALGKIADDVYERLADDHVKQCQELQAELAERQTRSLDLGETLSFAKFLMDNAATLWTALAIDGKQRLQTAIFPEGVTYASGVFGTPPSCLFSMTFLPPALLNGGLVDQTGVEPDFGAFVSW
jgi:hypothetical protein